MNYEILKELKYNGALLEEIRSQKEAILEGQKGQASSVDVRLLQQGVAELKHHKSLPAHVAHGHA